MTERVWWAWRGEHGTSGASIAERQAKYWGAKPDRAGAIAMGLYLLATRYLLGDKSNGVAFAGCLCFLFFCVANNKNGQKGYNLPAYSLVTMLVPCGPIQQLALEQIKSRKVPNKIALCSRQTAF